MQSLATLSTMASPTASHLLENGLHPPVCSSLKYGWKNIVVEEFHQPPGQENYQNLAEHTICMSLNSRPYRLMQVMGDRHHTGLSSKGDMTIAPAGQPFFCQWHKEEHYLRIRIASQFLKQVAQEALDFNSNQIELVPEFRTRNSQIEQLGSMLLGELKNEGLAGQLYVESLTNLIAVNLLRSYSAVFACVALFEGRLSDRQLLQVTDYINEHLAQDIKLADLGQLLGISQFHFSRLFKQSMGVTPHHYVLRQRVEKAKRLLKETDLSVVEIALLCGFSSHSHLGKWFRQHTGITPKGYRAG